MNRFNLSIPDQSLYSRPLTHVELDEALDMLERTFGDVYSEITWTRDKEDNDNG
jgi:hypothetical protein